MNRNNYIQELNKAIIYGKLPQEACEWPVIEVKATTVLRGGGESTSYHGYVTIRSDGKQIWHGTSYEFKSDKPLDQIQGKLHQFAKTLYALERLIVNETNEQK